jgi:hypothetical protein
MNLPSAYGVERNGGPSDRAANIDAVLRRALPLVPLAAALAADGASAHRLAFYVLLLAIPAAVVAALDRFGEALEGETTPAAALLGAVVVVLVVLSEAVRGPHLVENAAPPLALSALAAALVVVAAQSLRRLVSASPRRAPTPGSA